MIKFLKPAFILLSHFLFLNGIYGQVQINVEDYIKEKFLGYCDAVPREEIFIHTDRTDYIAGEDFWFNVFLVDRQSTTPSTFSKIVYFELLNQGNHSIIQKRINMDKGFGPGQIILPDTLSTGTYTIRAYTRWMKNFLPENCFMKDIRVFNAFSEKAYKGKVYRDNSLSEETMSEPVNQGLTLRVNNFNTEYLELFIDTDNGYSRDNNNTFILFIQTHGLINHISTQTIVGESTKVSLSKKVLTPGINHITVFSSKGEPLRERFIYTPDNEGPTLAVSTSESVGKRSKVSLDFEVAGVAENRLNSSRLSISVAPLADNPLLSEINEYMVFGSEFGIVPWNTIQGRKISDFSPEVIDSLLLIVKSNWIIWDAVLKPDLPDFIYQAEREDYNLSGSLISRNTLLSDTDQFIFMSTPGKEALFQYAKTDSEGKFNFALEIDNLYKDLIIQPAVPDNNFSVRLESPFSDKYYLSEISNDPLNKIAPAYLSKLSVNYQVSKIYETSFTGDYLYQIFPSFKPVRFYGRPDIELIMDDYIKLPVMEEVFFELIPGAYMRRKNNVWEISISDPVDYQTFETPPALMIDGVIIHDASLIVNLDPEIVERIDIVKERYLVGDYLIYGIINVITMDGDYSSVDLPDYATRLSYRVIDPVRSFVSPDYSSEEVMSNRIPDFRNTLYWNPSIITDNTGKGRVEFWSCDVAADYEINIQGITPEGKLISYKKIIRVE